MPEFLCHPERSRGTPDLSLRRLPHLDCDTTGSLGTHPRSLHEWAAVFHIEKDPGSLGFARDDTKKDDGQ